MNGKIKMDKTGIRKKLGSVGVVLAGVGVVALAAFWPKEEEKLPIAVPPPVNVKVEKITPLPELRDEIRLPGKLEAWRSVKVSAEVAGQVKRWGAKEGADVAAEQVLIFLDTDLLKAAYERAKAQHEHDRIELERVEGLEKRDVATHRELDQAQTTEAISRASLAIAGTELDRARIRAPLAGVLNDYLVEPGEYVQVGGEVAEIVEIDRLKVVVDLAERDVRYFKVGDAARIVVESLGDLKLTGKMTYLSSTSDPETLTYRTEITVANPGRQVRPGCIARVYLLRRKFHQAIVIPLSAVIPLEEGYQVFVVEGDTARARKVKLGLLLGEKVQVVSGLRAGERLIVEGHRMVGNGQKVVVINAETRMYDNQ